MKRIEFLFLLIIIVLIISFSLSFFLNQELATRFWALATNIGDERIYLFLAVTIFFFYPTIGIFLLVMILLNGMINFFIKWYFNIPRPPNPKIHESGPSFPSNHAQSSGTFWTAINLKYRSYYLLVLGIVYTIFISYSRLALSVHYPIDVIAGSIFGFLVALAGYFLTIKIKINSLVLYEILLILIFVFSLMGYYVYEDPDFARTSFFSLGFATLYPFIKDNKKSFNITAIAFIIWLIVALLLLFLNNFNLYIQYYLLGISAPLLKYLVYKLSK